MARTSLEPRRLGEAFALLVALVLGCFAVGAGTAMGAETPDAPDAVPGEILVAFEDPEAAELSVDAAEGTAQVMALDLEEGELGELLADASADEAAPAIVEGFDVEEAEIIASDIAGQSVVSLELANEDDTDALIDALDAIPGVMAQPNYRYQLVDSTSTQSVLLSDEYYDLEYYLGPLGDGSGDSGANLEAAWQALTSVDDLSSVTVAVIDTGLDLSHPDLQENVLTDLAYDAWAEKPLAGDKYGHGTHVAGEIVATANNGIGIAGAASGAYASLPASLVRVLPVNVFDDDDGAPVSAIIRGFDYVLDLKKSGKASDIRVVNLSLGIYEHDLSDKNDKLFQDGIDELTENGVLCVASGGNGDGHDPYTEPCYPSDYENVLSVTSLTQQGANSEFSDYNMYKDISAPGEDIASTTPIADGAYVYRSGTSMASPIVSSAAALIASANPDLTPADIQGIICETAAPLPDDSNSHAGETGSAGALDAHAAVVRAIKLGGGSVPEPGDGTAPVYRLYNTFTGEHLLTADHNEYVTLRRDYYGSWRGEGEGFTVNPKDAEESAPVYRLYNPNNGDHFYTESEAEVASLEALGWHNESIGWRSVGEDEGIPVYRLYNPFMTGNQGRGNHLWTTDANELGDLTSLGWQLEECNWRAY